jgi:hypothetical protein
MSDENPSPGPWRWKPPSESSFSDPAGLKDAHGADILGCSNDAEYIYAHSDADAALIADAPAMLELLRDLEDAGLDRGPACPQCLSPEGEKHGEEELGRPCRLGALLDKHGRG